MAILGLYDGHNSCAAVISEETGEIIAAVEEERFSRIKNHDSRRPDMPGPVHSIAFCAARSTEPIRHVALALAAPDDLARQSVNAFLGAVRDGDRRRLDSVKITDGDFYELLRLPQVTQAQRLAACLTTLAEAGIAVQPGGAAAGAAGAAGAGAGADGAGAGADGAGAGSGAAARLHHVPHHLAHAAAAFLRAPADDALVVVLDGMGDGLSGLIADGRGHTMRPLATIDSAQSLGHLYSAFTLACGFEVLRHEGKVTALAAAGLVNERVYAELAELFRFDPVTGGLRGGLSTGLALGPYPHRLAAEYNERVRQLVAGVPVADAAATVQRFTEEIVTRLIGHHVAATGHRAVALAGGVFANVSVNRRIAGVDGVERVYVHPAMSDAGLAVGAASAVYAQLRGRRPPPLRDAFLGPDYAEQEAVAWFRKAGFTVLDAVAPEAHLADVLAEGRFVARFVGRAEYGPRALGNRSILAPCGDPRTPEVLNKMLRRSQLMPFAPISLVEEADRLYHGLDVVSWSAKYMTVALDCSAVMREQSPAAVHQDGTARPQLVGPDNVGLQALLRRYFARTNSATLINTSLNLHDEPMVLTPADAARSVSTAGIDVVQVNGLICTRS
jgi:carbamoyltransferase